ncbi:MAG: two-component response regulator [Elusimicrobia bacterium]|nr:MAG: two-component response regulator [Elusimicrobiota bacterium]
MSATILVADDDFDNRAILRQALEAAGWRVVEAVDGLEAVEAACKGGVDLIFLDMSMPKLSGWEAAKRIRQDPAAQGIPILAFTAHAMEGDALKARAAGCDDYVTKPCAPREVVAKVRGWLARGGRSSTETR